MEDRRLARRRHPCATDHVDARVSRLHGADLRGDLSATTVPLELLLDEAFELEVEEEDVS